MCHKLAAFLSIIRISGGTKVALLLSFFEYRLSKNTMAQVNGLNSKDVVILLVILVLAFLGNRELNSIRVELAELRGKIPGSSNMARNEPKFDPEAEKIRQLFRDKARSSTSSQNDPLVFPGLKSSNKSASDEDLDTRINRLRGGDEVALDEAVLRVSMANLSRSVQRIPAVAIGKRGDSRAGVKIEAVPKGSLAALIELQQGDILTSADDNAINSVDDLEVFFRNLSRNGQANLTIERGGKQRKIVYRVTGGLAR